MKVCCQRMGIIFSLHLALSALHFSLYSFLECHNYDYQLTNHQYVCTDLLTSQPESFREKNSEEIFFENITEENYYENILEENYHENILRNTTTTTLPPNPATTPTPLNVSQIVLNILSQLFLPLIPASFLHTVRTILSE